MLIESEKPQPLVSVIIPTYNRPAYLKEALASVVAQTYQNIEIIVSDNCSLENPQPIVESFQDERIQFWRNEKNIGGFANAINTFKKTKGKYVASLLDDDVWEKDFLEKLVPHLEANPDLTIAFCDHYIINSESTIDYVATEKYTQLYKRNQLTEGVYKPFYQMALVDQAVSTATAAVIRNDVIDWNKIPPEVGSSWDVYLGYLCSCSGRGAYYHPGRLTRYREHPQTQTMLSGKRDVQGKIQKAKADIFCFERFIEDEQLKKFHPHFQQRLAHELTTLGIGLLRNKQATVARSCFLRALQYQKFSLRTIGALIFSFMPKVLASRV